MKPYIKIILFTLLLILLLGVKGAKAHDEFTRVIKKEFIINPDAQITINNKFGKVHCNNWEKNAASFEVTITVAASSQEAADKMFDRISIALVSVAPSNVSATTTMSENKGPQKGRFSIDYKVEIPVTVSLDITNKFGDIFVNEILGKGKINLGYGNLEANKLGNSDNLLDIKFSKAKINWMKGAVLMLKYSEMDLGYAGSLRLDSKFSNLDAEKIVSLNVDFEGGNLNMESSSAVDSRTKFSDLEIGRIEQSLALDIQYGSCDVREMPASFTSVSIKNKYGNVSIGLDDQSKYSLDAQLKFCDLDYPEGKAKFSYRSINHNEKSYVGIVGGETTTTARVTVRSEFGNVSLK
jgi:hypothetical protein